MKNLKIFEKKTNITSEEIKKYIKNIKKEGIDKYLLFIRMDENYTNQLDDYCFYLDEKNDILLCMRCTTKAGHYYVFNPISYGGIKGTAVLKEGLYKDTHQVVGTYRFGIYDLELIQIKPVYIYRDTNKDKRINRDIIQYGYYGINVHTSGWTTIIDRWSAGCLSIYKPEWEWFKKNYLKINNIYTIELILLNDFNKKIKEI